MSSSAKSTDDRRILALATNPIEGASTRFRVFQWKPYLERAGFKLQVQVFYSAAASRMLYHSGKYPAKFRHFVAGAIRRCRALASAARSADILLIHREAFPLGWRFAFRRIREFPGAVIYDYDDAMFLPQRQGRGVLSWLEGLDAPAQVMALSDVVLAGNKFLADYAHQYARRVALLPTCIDTEKFRPSDRPRSSDKCVVGWIGSHSTARYLRSLLLVLERVASEHRFDLYVVGSSAPLHARGFEVTQAQWCLQREVEDFQRCDVGIYPLWDDDWSRGKCGFKAIQFMACGVPVVVAAVGVNREIIQDGVNGFLAATDKEWEEKLGWLVSDPSLREKLGRAGRETILERYSLDIHAPRLISALQEAVGRDRGTG